MSSGSDHKPAGAKAGANGPAPVSDTSAKNLHRDGDILIAGEPTPAGLEALHAQGVKTVIDLRTEPDKMATEKELAQKLGMKYFAIPMQSNELTDQQAAELLRAMKQHDHGEVLIHCAGGNRAAGAYGYYLGATGQCPIQEALERAKNAGLKNPQLAESVRQRLTTRPAGAPATQPHR